MPIIKTEIINHLYTQEHLQRAVTASKIISVLAGLAAVAGVAAFAYFHFSSLGSTIASHCALYGTPAVTALGIIGIATLVVLKKKLKLEEKRIEPEAYLTYFQDQIGTIGSAKTLTRMSKGERKEFFKHVTKINHVTTKAILFNLFGREEDLFLENLPYVDKNFFTEFFQQTNQLYLFQKTLEKMEKCVRTLKDRGETKESIYLKIQKQFGFRTITENELAIGSTEVVCLFSNLKSIFEKVKKLPNINDLLPSYNENYSQMYNSWLLTN
jgi:DNA mismatch repair ATPase MutL